jgi:tRNA(Arg) A34 adenosine deaminase TadA
MRPTVPARRRLLLALGGLGVGLATRLAWPASASAAEIPQPAHPTRAAFMARAFTLRRLAIDRGDQPFGAVIVRDGQIVGEGASAVITAPDPTAHAEMQAIRDAAQRLRTRDLAGGEMYGTSRACPMCQAGAYWAGLSRLWYGEAIADGGMPRLP